MIQFGIKRQFLLLFISFQFVSGLVFCQNAKVLHSNLKLARTDTEKIGLLLKLGEWHYKNGSVLHPRSKDSIVFFALKAADLSKTLKDQVGIGNSYILLSRKYSHIDYKKAAESARKAINAFEDIEDKIPISLAYCAWFDAEIQKPLFNSKSDSSLKSGNNHIDELHYHLNTIENYYDKLDNVSGLEVLCTLIRYNIILKKRAKTDKYAGNALNLLETKNSFPAANFKIRSALMHYFFYIKDYEKCKKYTLEYQKTSSENDYQSFQNAHNFLFKIDSAQGNYSSALEHYKTAKHYGDRILNKQRTKEITKLEIEYETHEKESNNKLLKKQSELQKNKLSKTQLEKNIALIGIITLIIFIGLIYRRYWINQRIRNDFKIKNDLLEKLLIEKEWLLKEIHHRVKNNLQIVMSLLNTQSHFLKDQTAKAAIRTSQDRIHSMSLIHKKLYQSEDVMSINMELYIRELIEYFKSTFDIEHQIKFLLDADLIELTASQAVPVGLIINETVINSIKHAFPNDQSGEISIKFHRDDSRITLRISDNGIGLQHKDGAPLNSSLGIGLIQRFNKELDGTLTYIYENGFGISLNFISTSINNNK